MNSTPSIKVFLQAIAGNSCLLTVADQQKVEQCDHALTLLYVDIYYISIYKLAYLHNVRGYAHEVQLEA